MSDWGNEQIWFTKSPSQWKQILQANNPLAVIYICGNTNIVLDESREFETRCHVFWVLWAAEFQHFYHLLVFFNRCRTMFEKSIPHVWNILYGYFWSAHDCNLSLDCFQFVHTLHLAFEKREKLSVSLLSGPSHRKSNKWILFYYSVVNLLHCQT